MNEWWMMNECLPKYLSLWLVFIVSIRLCGVIYSRWDLSVCHCSPHSLLRTSASRDLSTRTMNTSSESWAQVPLSHVDHQSASWPSCWCPSVWHLSASASHIPSRTRWTSTPRIRMLRDLPLKICRTSSPRRSPTWSPPPTTWSTSSSMDCAARTSASKCGSYFRQQVRAAFRCGRRGRAGRAARQRQFGSGHSTRTSYLTTRTSVRSDVVNLNTYRSTRSHTPELPSIRSETCTGTGSVIGPE